MKKTQKQMILEHLQKYHSITDLEAYQQYAIRRTGARVWDLRAEGYPIKTEMTTKPNRFGIKTTFATYILEEEK